MERLIAQTTDFLKRWSLQQYLLAAIALLIVLSVVQVLRFGVTHVQARTIVWSLQDSTETFPTRDMAKELTEYDVILEKGVLGTVPKPQPQPIQVFGILGSKAYLGTNQGDTKPYDVGGEIPGGEKITEISATSVTLEKDGETRTLYVFPTMKPALPKAGDGKPAKTK